jgi:hypothetical protein
VASFISSARWPRTLGRNLSERILLKKGNIFFILMYEDEDARRPMINTCEYVGKESATSKHLFRFLESGDQIELTDDQLSLALDLDGLIKELSDLRDGKNPFHYYRAP